MVPIGFSTGCVWRFEKSLLELLRAFRSVNASAVELKVRDIEQENFSSEVAGLCEEFSFVSLHAPAQDLSDEQASRLVDLAEQVGARSIVVHPDQISDFSVFDGHGVFVFENMDSRKESFRSLEEFSELVDSSNRFVIDLQHVYENDPSMGLTEGFVDLFSGKISHLHVSGESADNIHAPLAVANNTKSILSAVPAGVPIIFEGDLDPSRDLKAQLHEEMSFFV